MNIAIIGGGSSAHILAALLGKQSYGVRILSSRPHEWQNQIELQAGSEKIYGQIQGASNNPRDVLADADVAILCMPVHQYNAAIMRIMPVLAQNPKCIIGTVYGQGGFDWMVKSFAKKLNIETPRHFAIGLLPWIARTISYGNSAISYGPKFRNGVACSDDETFEILATKLLKDFSYNYWGTGLFERIPNFLTVTLTVDNQIIHPSRCYALAANGNRWESNDDIPYFYRDWDDNSAEILRGIDSDYANVRQAIIKQFPDLQSPYNLDYLDLEHWSYGSYNPDIKASFVNSSTLKFIKPPTIQENGEYVLDVDHRFFKDDFACGLEICEWFATEFCVDVPNVKKLIDWYRKEIQPRQSMVVESGIPPLYGLTLNDIIA